MRNLHLAALLLIIIFLWTRFYQIETSLYFFNDMGRDFLVLWQWQNTGKPPLLGPQTSVLPFNQSAIYFYLLYPFYLLSGASPYASLIALSLLYVSAFVAGLYFLRAYPRLEKSLLLVFLMIIVQPEYILQGRFVWNPSFVTPFILVAGYSLLLLLLQKKPRQLLLLINAASLAIASALSYSVVPTMVAFVLYLAYQRPRLLGRYLLYLGASLAVVNLPTLVFELRHDFLLTQMLLFGDRLTQSQNFFLARLANLSRFSFHTTALWAGIFFATFTFFVVMSKRKQPKDAFLTHSTWLFFLSLGLTLLAPSTIHAHYIFGVLPLFFLLLSFIQRRYLFVCAVFFYVVWLQAALRFNYFAPARNDYATLSVCAAKICQNHSEPLFVANQSKHHPYHNAMEWQYLLTHAGCQVKNLNLEPEAANSLVLMLDDATYEHGQTAFYELTLFGAGQEAEHLTCSDTLEAVFLTR